MLYRFQCEKTDSGYRADTTHADELTMAKTGYQTWWVPEAKADLKILRAQHQRVFKGNQLAIVDGYIKVAVLDGEKAQTPAITYPSFKQYQATLPPKTMIGI